MVKLNYWLFLVTVKELHIQYGVKFSEIINSYQNRLEDLKSGYDILISELRQKHSEILHLSAKLLDQYSK